MRSGATLIPRVVELGAGDRVERHVSISKDSIDPLTRTLSVPGPFDLARTVAPVWWARGRWPNVDWTDGVFTWVGWEHGHMACRSVRQIDECTIEIQGASDASLDLAWASTVLGAGILLPDFSDCVLARLSGEHAGLRQWSAGSLFAGVVSSIVGQSISVAAAATSQRRFSWGSRVT